MSGEERQPWCGDGDAHVSERTRGGRRAGGGAAAVDMADARPARPASAARGLGRRNGEELSRLGGESGVMRRSNRDARSGDGDVSTLARESVGGGATTADMADARPARLTPAVRRPGRPQRGERDRVPARREPSALAYRRRPLAASAKTVIAALAALLVLTGCATGATAPDPAAALPAEARTAYDEYWAAWLAAQETDDPTALSARTADPLLTSLTRTLAEKAARDEVTRGPVTRNITAVEPAGEGYSVAACVDLDRQRDHHRDGTEVERQLADKPTTQLTVVLRLRDGVWKAVNLYYDGACGPA